MSLLVDSVEGNRQRLDGGAMFGSVPHALWSRWIAPDQRMRIPLAARGFLIRDQASQRLTLLEAGIGAFFEPKLADRYGVDGEGHVLLASLEALGVAPEDIDFVVLSHLHFDHAGGLLAAYSANRRPELVFPRAQFIVGKRAFERAENPHPRDRASFIPELPGLLRDSGRLRLIDDDGQSFRELLGDRFSCRFSDGHTPGMLLTEVRGDARKVVFCGDVIPGLPWVHVPVAMGYDRFPERVIDEKRALLEQCVSEHTMLLVTHDPTHVACDVACDERGRYRPIEPRTALRSFAI